MSLGFYFYSGRGEAGSSGDDCDEEDSLFLTVSLAAPRRAEGLVRRQREQGENTVQVFIVVLWERTDQAAWAAERV